MPIDVAQITGLVLAGGRGARMGGADKGLQMLHGRPLAAHALERLAPQVGALMISANRHPDRYATLGAPYGAEVIADTLPDFAGPLAGLLAGLRHARTPYVLSVPCDTPAFPADLAAHFAAAVDGERTHCAYASTSNADGTHSPHPVFALTPASLADDLEAFLAQGERRVRAWYARHMTRVVNFADERAFYNVNSLQQLADLDRA